MPLVESESLRLRRGDQQRMPLTQVPSIVLGGDFNDARHQTRIAA